MIVVVYEGTRPCIKGRMMYVDATRSNFFSLEISNLVSDSIFDEVILPELPSFGHRPSDDPTPFACLDKRIDDFYESSLRAVW